MPTPSPRGYHLLRPLPDGEPGVEIWDAAPEPGGEPVTLRIIRTILDPRHRAAWVRELRMAGRVRSPHLSPVLDAGPVIAPLPATSADTSPAGIPRTLAGPVPEDEPWYVVTPPTRGPTLATLAGRLPIGAVLDATLQLCDALTHLHELELHDFVDEGGEAPALPGLLHRDVRPECVRIEQDGRVVLDGLGLWRVSPQSLHGAEEALEPTADASADLFSLACTVHTLVVGKPPFADRSEIRRVEDRLAEPSFLAPLDQALRGLGDVLYPCFRRRPEDRWRSARDLADALRALYPQVGGLSAAVPPGVFRRPQPFSTPPVAPTASLIGRSEEIDGVVRQLKGTARVIVLDGPPGIGRSSVAAAVVDRLGEDGWPVVEVDHRGLTTAGAHSWALARALGVGLDPVDPNGRLGRVLGRRGRVLVVAKVREEGSETLAPAVAEWMASAPEARFLVVGLLPGLRVARRLVLNRITGAAGAELLATRAAALHVARDPVAVELAMRLRGLPGAIQLAARALVRGTTLESLAARVTDRLSLHRDGLVVMLEVVRELLPDWTRAAIRQLAILEGPFGVATAAAVLDLSAWPEAPFATGVLTELVDAGLVVEVAGPSGEGPADLRYRVPDHVRSWILASRPSLDLELCSLRRALHLAQLGTPTALGAIERQLGALAPHRLQEEVPDLLAALAAAIERGRQHTAVSLVQVLVAVLRERMPVSTLLDAVARVLSLPDLSDGSLALLHRSAAEVCLVAGMTTESIRHRERALVFSVRAGDRRTEALLRASAGSIGNIQQGLRVAESLCDPHLSGRIRLRLGEALVADQQLELAHEHLTAAVDRLEAAGDVAAEARARRLLGRVMIELHNLEGGLQQLSTALLALRGLRALEETSDCRVEIAGLQLDLGQPISARELLEQALADVRSIGDAAREAAVCSALGEVELWSGALDEALQHLDDAERVQRRAAEAASRGKGDADPVALALTLSRLGATYLEIGRARDARPVLEEALFQAGSHPMAGAEAHLALAALELHEGAHDDARNRLLALLPTARRAGGTRLGRVMMLLGRRSVREGEPDSALERLTHAVQDLGGRHVGWASLARLELARIQDASGLYDQAAEGLRRAVEDLRAAGFAPSLGLALASRSRLRRLADRLDEASEDLEEARRIALRCGVRNRSPLQRAIDAAS